MSAFEKLVDTLRAHGSTVKESSDGKAVAQCPAHNDGRPSLSISPRDDSKGAVVYCHAGCVYTDVLDELGLTACDLFDDAQFRNAYRNNATYVYPDGRKVHRKPDKTFPQSGNTKGRSLYHADMIGNADTVYVPEGEKDVLAIESVGGTAVCSAMGAGKAHLADWFPLTGKHVIIVADDDEPGLNHADEIAELLDSAAASVTIVKAAVGKDAADHIAAGKTLADFVPVVGFADTMPIPLMRVVSLPSFPVDAFPKSIADMVHAVAEATQTDPVMAGTSALTALSACAGGHAEVEIRSGWREPLCSYTATVADPGERKSAVQQAMIRPILDVEAEMTDTALPLRQEAQARKDIAVKAMERAFNIAAKATPGTPEYMQAQNDALMAQTAADNIDVPEVPRLVADDVTPEAVASLLADHGGRIAVVSAEGGVFDIIAGRYNANIPNMDVWLKGHSGDMIRIDRKGRPPEYIRKPALTLGLMIQPDVLKSIAAQRAFRGRGLIARFLYALPKSQVGYRKTGAPPVSEAVRTAYDDDIRKIAEGMAGWLGDPAALTLTPEAHAAIEVIEAEIEPALREDGALADLKDWGSKYVGAVARIAGLLHLAELGATVGPTTSISADTVWRAADIGTYFRFAAIAAFQVMATDPGITDAIYLLGRIKTLGTDEVSERDMHRACQSRFPKKDVLLAAIERLVDHGYLQPLTASQQKGKGRPASPKYKVHPLAKH
jgi:hypothetical protein